MVKISIITDSVFDCFPASKDICTYILKKKDMESINATCTLRGRGEHKSRPAGHYGIPVIHALAYFQGKECS